jgi:membrane-bound serine protease (ClpP class)
MKSNFLAVLILLLFIHSAKSQNSITGSKKVFVLELKSEVDPRTNRYIKLGLKQAVEDSADLIILEMNTYGGTLSDADEIRTNILQSKIPVYVFINKNAASAGALISIACKKIYMAPAANIGAATVVTEAGAAAPDKYQSYMRSIMRSTAEANGRNPRYAEGMVDPDVETDSVKKAGKVITFTTSEAIKNGYCEGQVNSIEEILKLNNIDNFTRTDFALPKTEKVIAFFLNPFISGLLILLIIGGIYFELQTPGIGFPLLAAIVAAVLYFVPYYLNGLAENWEILLFFAGLILIALEIFVIPGFGIVGILGIVLTFGSLVLVMLNNDNFDFSLVESGNILTSVFTMLIGFVGSIILMVIGGFNLTRSKYFKRIALQTSHDRSEGYTSSFHVEKMIGKKGVSQSILRPSGKILIEGSLFDAYTRGEYIEKGEEIEVISEEGTTLMVRKI